MVQYFLTVLRRNHRLVLTRHEIDAGRIDVLIEVNIERIVISADPARHFIYGQLFAHDRAAALRPQALRLVVNVSYAFAEFTQIRTEPAQNTDGKSVFELDGCCGGCLDADFNFCCRPYPLSGERPTRHPNRRCPIPNFS